LEIFFKSLPCILVFLFDVQKIDIFKIELFSTAYLKKKKIFQFQLEK
jgi:hypothetical protein